MEMCGRAHASHLAPGHELDLPLPCRGTRTGGLGDVPLACRGGSVPVVTASMQKEKKNSDPPWPHPRPPQLGHVQHVSPVRGAGNTEQLMQEKIFFHIHLQFFQKKINFLSQVFHHVCPRSWTRKVIYE